MAELKGRVAPEQISTNNLALPQLKSGREGETINGDTGGDGETGCSTDASAAKAGSSGGSCGETSCAGSGSDVIVPADATGNSSQ